MKVGVPFAVTDEAIDYAEIKSAPLANVTTSWFCAASRPKVLVESDMEYKLIRFGANQSMLLSKSGNISVVPCSRI